MGRYKLSCLEGSPSLAPPVTVSLPSVRCWLCACPVLGSCIRAGGTLFIPRRCRRRVQHWNDEVSGPGVHPRSVIYLCIIVGRRVLGCAHSLRLAVNESGKAFSSSPCMPGTICTPPSPNLGSRRLGLKLATSDPNLRVSQLLGTQVS